jgi:hypothetical protein
VHLLSRSNGGEDPALGDFGLCMVGKIHWAGGTRVYCCTAAISATVAEQL